MAKTSIIKETRDILKEAVPAAKKHWGDPPDGQVPVNDSGWYTSPNLQHADKGVDPRDCEQWPSSPYCGGNPWSKTPVGLDVDWGVGKCGAWVEVEPILGFTKLPPVSVGYRPPGECREEEKPKEPPPDPKDIDESRPVDPLDMPDTIPDAATVFILIIQSYNYYQVYDSPKISSNPGSTIQQINEATGETRYPILDARVPSYFPQNGVQTQVPAIAIAGSVKTFSTKIDRRNQKTTNQIIKNAKAWLSSDQVPPDVPNFKRYTARTLNNKYIITQLYATDEVDANQRGGVLVYGKYGDIKADWKGFVVDSVGLYNNGETIVRIKEEYKIGYISLPQINKHPPPPDLIKKKKCCMQCCSGGNQQANKQNQDNAEILKLLRQIKKAIGVDEYPVKMPASLNTDYNDNGQKSNPGTVTEENLTSVLGRFIRYFDGVMGEWGIGFKVADADPTKEGDQPKFIHAPNLAELSAEMYSHIFDMWIMQYQLLHLHQRHAIESMLGRKVGIQNYYLLEALVDWCGFKRKDITKKIPFLFDIDSEKFDDFLKNKEQEIQILDFDPDDENSESFPDQMLRLKRMAAIIEATHTKRFNPNEDISKSVMGILQTLSKNTDRVNKDEVKKEGSEPDFDQWLREAETAFVNKTGQGDPNSPYGVPYAQRPRLTKLQEEPEQPTE